MSFNLFNISQESNKPFLFFFFFGGGGGVVFDYSNLSRVEILFSSRTCFLYIDFFNFFLFSVSLVYCFP